MNVISVQDISSLILVTFESKQTPILPVYLQSMTDSNENFISRIFDHCVYPFIPFLIVLTISS